MQLKEPPRRFGCSCLAARSELQQPVACHQERKDSAEFYQRPQHEQCIAKASKTAAFCQRRVVISTVSRLSAWSGFEVARQARYRTWQDFVPAVALCGNSLLARKEGMAQRIQYAIQNRQTRPGRATLIGTCTCRQVPAFGRRRLSTSPLNLMEDRHNG